MREIPSFMREILDLIGEDAAIEIRHTPSHTEAPVNDFFAQFQPVIGEMDPGAQVVPTLVSGVTDARWFAKLGTPTYGFGPVLLPTNMPFWGLFHSADERIPIAGLGASCRAVYRVLEQY